MLETSTSNNLQVSTSIGLRPDPLLNRFRCLVETAQLILVKVDRIGDAISQSSIPCEPAGKDAPCLDDLENIYENLRFAINGIDERVTAIEEKLGK